MEYTLNLKKCEQIITGLLNNDYGFDTKVSYEDDNSSVSVNANITLNGIDDGIMFSVTAYDDASIYLQLFLDKIDKNLNTLNLLNTFNDNSLYLKGAITESGYFCVTAQTPCISEDMIENFINEILSYFASEQLRKFLAPIAKLTYAE